MGVSEDVNAFSPAATMLRALESRQISAVELLEGHLQRISRFDGVLNSIVVRDFERARIDAKRADAHRADGQSLPLLGLPVTIKESVDVENLPSTAGVSHRVGHRAAKDAATVARLRNAGAVVFAKTNVCTWLADFQSDNPVYGRTNSPWDLTRTPGGSSGGSASLAAGLTALDLGSDLGGSIRVPAAFCGLWGHKPSAGITPNTGHFPGSDLPNPAFPMATQGFHARSAKDLQIALEVVMGPDNDMQPGWRLQLPPARHDRVKDFRVAVLPPVEWVAVDPEIIGALSRVCDQLRHLGVDVVEMTPPGLGDLREHYRIFRSMMAATVSTNWPPEYRRQMVDAMLARQETFHTADADGYRATAPDLAGWLGRRAGYRAAWAEFFREWDILLTPMTLVPAFEHASGATADRRLRIGDVTTEFDYLSFYPSLATLAGQPAVAFPAGLNAGGLPMGLQAIGPLWEDQTVLRFVQLMEVEFGKFESPPGYDGDFS